jgi:hypothetical protein
MKCTICGKEANYIRTIQTLYLDLIHLTLLQAYRCKKHSQDCSEDKTSFKEDGGR